MSRPSGPTSPLSSNSNDSGYHPRYDGPTLSNATYTGGPYAAARPRPSPPSSGHPSSSTDMSRPSAAGSSTGRPPSSASSIGQHSNYGRGSGPMPRPPMPMDRRETEEALQRHYNTLKQYLASSLQDEKGNIKPNRARDKLLRLSPTQFMELSTDVFDELIRREDERLQRVPNVPRALPPKSTFHPKRNQARQKLSTLPLERFKQLATDVFYELERRIPRVAAGLDLERPGSAASTRSRGGPPPRGPPPPGGFRGPPGARGPPSMGGGYPPQSPGFPPGARPPQPKTFQSSTIIPNKGTMVEDDDEDEEAEEDEDAFGLDRVMSGLADRNLNLNSPRDEDRKRMEEQDMEIAELRRKVESLEEEVEQHGGNSGNQEWASLREELEQKHMDAQRLNEDLRRELEQLHRDKQQDEREIRAQHDRSLGDLRAQLDNMHNQTDDLQVQLENHRLEKDELRRQVEKGQRDSASSSETEKRRIEILEAELATQEKLTNEVRNEAMTYLKEMRELSRQNDRAIEQEEKLAAQVSNMEKEISEWRNRYARVKVQNKSLRASTMGLSLQTSFDAASLLRGNDSMISEGGLVKDIDISRFQLAIDELVQVARQPASSASKPLLDTVKNVVVSVQAITSAIGTDGYPTPSHSPSSPETNSGNNKQPVSVAKLKTRVTGTANALITATKQHSSSMGLSPVALLDAAAGNLSAAIVELIKAVGIRPSPKAELQQHAQDSMMLDLDVVSASRSSNNHHQHGGNSNNNKSMSSFYDDSASPVHDDYDHHQQQQQQQLSTANGLAIQVQPPPPPSESASSSYLGHEEDELDIEDAYAVETPVAAAESTQQQQQQQEKPKPAPLNLGGLGRSNTMKKWFGGWGRSASSGEGEGNGNGNGNGSVTPIATTPLTAGGNMAHHMGGLGSEEYEEFR